MEVYIGMDISLQTTHLCVVDKEGNKVHEGSTLSEVAALELYINKHCKSWNINRIVFETGQLSSHLFHCLKASGLPVVCIDARHAHGVLKAQRIKSDKNDARGLAQIARTGWYNAVHVKSSESQNLHTLTAGRKQLVETRLTLENHIRGMLKTFGIKLGIVTATGFAAKVKETISKEAPMVKDTMLALLKAREGLFTQEKSLDKQCKAIAKEDKVCKRLMTIPGIGVQTALAFKAEIDDPSRFKSSRDVGVHIGLTPKRYASGEIDRSGSISKQGNGSLRSLLFEAAVSMLTRSKKWSRLKAWGVKLAERSNFRNACTAVARKVAVIMHRMWVDKTEFVYAEPKTITT